MAVSLDLIKSVSGVVVKPPKVVLYGLGGIGKTTWAAGAPKPKFIFTEESQGLMDLERFEIRDGDPLVRSWEELIACLQWLNEREHSFETVVIDTLDFAEHLLWKYTAAKHNQEDIEAFGFGKGYGHALTEARVMLGWLDVLRSRRNMAIVIICHEEIKKFDAPDAESYDRYQLRLQPRLAAHVKDWSDALLFADYERFVVKDKEAFNKQRKRGVGEGNRVVYTQERPAFWAKNRYGLPFKLPLDWASFQGGIVAPQSATAKKDGS